MDDRRSAVRLRIDELASLWMETPTAPAQVSLLLVLEATGPDPLTAEGLAGLLAARAEELPALRRRIRRVGRDDAEWVPDSSPVTDRIVLDAFDVSGEPVDAGPVVWRWAADRAVRPLPSDRPPWRVVIAREDGGGLAVLITAHHALVDGAQGLALVRALLGAPAPDAPSPASHAEPMPTAPARRGTGRRQRLPARVKARVKAPVTARMATAGGVLAALAALRGREPDVGLRRVDGTGRALEVVHRPLKPVHEAARALGVTLTDVVLAGVTSALREVCAARGGVDPGLVLRASVPIAQPGGGQAAGLMVAPLPVGEADLGRRLAVVASATAPVRARVRRARAAAGVPPRRRRPAAASDSVPAAVRGSVPGPVLALIRRGMMASRVWGETRVTAAVTTLHGPAQAWLLPGARITDIVPIAPLTDRVRVSVTAVSYAGTLTVAVHTGEGLDPRGTLGHALGNALDQLLATPVEPDTP